MTQSNQQNRKEMSKEKDIREMYMIFRKDGSILLGTERYGRNDCIDRFTKDSRYTWKQWYTMGARCKKVKITYEEL